jgi:putative ABC transport system permease protein
VFFNLQYAVRSLSKTPWLTAVVVVTLAVGIAANTAVFSWTRGVLLNPLRGVADVGRLFALETLPPASVGRNIELSYPDFRDYRDSSQSLAGAIAFHERALSLGDGIQAERVWAQFVSGNFFDVLGVKPVTGRFFRTEEREDAPGKYPVAVISERMWQRRFNADPEIIGKAVRLNGQDLTVIGVAPPEFLGTIVGLSYDVWLPLSMEPLLSGGGNRLENRNARWLHVLARLSAGASLPQAQAEIETIARRLTQSYPTSNTGIGATLVPISRANTGAQELMAPVLKTLLGAGAVLLLIVCANVANLMLLRATARQKEFDIRLALGASGLRVIGQLLLESLLLAGLGGAAGVALAAQMAGWLQFFAPATHLPVALNFPPDSTVLAFALTISLLAGLLCGLIPALQIVRHGRSGSLKGSGRGAVGDARAHRLRGGLVISEVALALVVLIGASLFLESFQHAKRTELGFDPSNVLLVGMDLSQAGYSTEPGKLFMRQLRDRVEAMPQVQAVSFGHAPLGFDRDNSAAVQVDGYLPRDGEDMKGLWAQVWPGYFDLMRIALIEGREFTDRDEAQALPVVIVNEAFAQRFFAGQEPVGRKLRLGGGERTVIAVVKDIKYHSLSESPQPFLYLPMQQAWEPNTGIGLLVRTEGAPEQIVPALQRELRSADPSVNLDVVFALSDFISASWFVQKVAASLLGVLGTLALLLAALGLFSVMAHTVAQRTQEIGIRMALGAQVMDVFRPVLGQALRLTMVGVGIGLALSFALTRLVASQLLGVSATDPLTFVGVSCLLCAVALAASYLPARRATRVDPMVALRAE